AAARGGHRGPLAGGAGGRRAAGAAARRRPRARVRPAGGGPRRPRRGELRPRRAAADAARGSVATVSASPTPTNPLPTTTDAIPLRARVRTAVHGWLSAGAARGGADALSIVRAAIAAALAYFVSGLIWGHEHPFLTAIVAFVIIGFGIEKKMRK